jgi:hypothetical protein
LITSDINNIGKEMHTAPIRCDIRPATVNGSSTRKLTIPRTAITTTTKSGTIPALISAQAHATRSNRNKAVNTPATDNPHTKNAQNKATAAKM